MSETSNAPPGGRLPSAPHDSELSSAALDEARDLHSDAAVGRYTAALEERVADLERRLSVLETTAAPSDPSALLGYDEAAARLGIGVRTLRNLVAGGAVRPVRIRGRVLFSSDALDAFARASASGIASAPKGRPGARRSSPRATATAKHRSAGRATT